MSVPRALTFADFALPTNIVSKSDVSRLVAEFEQVDDQLTTAAIRSKTGAGQPAPLSLSQQLTEFMNQNKLRPSTSKERSELIKQLRLLKDSVPVMHMTFAVEADRESLQQLVQWLRSSVHKQAVITVGIQPALIAGVYMRTPNHVRDLSLRASLKGSRGVLVKDLEALRGSR